MTFVRRRLQFGAVSIDDSRFPVPRHGPAGCEPRACVGQPRRFGAVPSPYPRQGGGREAALRYAPRRRTRRRPSRLRSQRHRCVVRVHGFIAGRCPLSMTSTKHSSMALSFGASDAYEPNLPARLAASAEPSRNRPTSSATKVFRYQDRRQPFLYTQGHGFEPCTAHQPIDSIQRPDRCAAGEAQCRASAVRRSPEPRNAGVLALIATADLVSSEEIA
jgi:hypothetical protein